MFQELGLSYYEDKTLQVLLKGELTLKQLSRRGIPAGKVSSVVKGLEEKNLLSTTSDRPKKVFVPDATTAIDFLIEQKKAQDESIFTQARALVTQAQRMQAKQTLFFQTGTTLKENEEVQMRSFTEAKKEVCQIINIHHNPSSNRKSKALWESAIKSAANRGVKFRCIYPKNTVLPKALRELQKNFSVKFIDKDFVRCDIIDQKKVLIKLVHEDKTQYGGIIFLEDEKFAKNLQAIFEQFWKEAS